MNQCPLCGSSNVDPAISREDLLEHMLDAALTAYHDMRPAQESDHVEAMREAISAALEVDTLR